MWGWAGLLRFFFYYYSSVSVWAGVTPLGLFPWLLRGPSSCVVYEEKNVITATNTGPAAVWSSTRLFVHARKIARCLAPPPLGGRALQTARRSCRRQLAAPSIAGADDRNEVEDPPIRINSTLICGRASLGQSKRARGWDVGQRAAASEPDRAYKSAPAALPRCRSPRAPHSSKPIWL